MINGKGYVLRDYKEHKEFGRYQPFESEIPKSEWKDRIDFLNATKSQPIHFHKRYCKVKNQRSTSLCWAYGTVSAVENAYARAGISGVELNAHALGYRIKGTDRRGGFALECCQGIEDYGIPEISVLPEFTKLRRWNSTVQESADKHKIVEFREIGKNNFEGCVSAIIKEQCAVTLAFDYWRHLVLGVGCTVNSKGDIGIIIANSWGTSYGDKGYSVVYGRKAVAYEAIAVKYIKSRKEE